MILNTLTSLFQLARRFWQFWSLGILEIMASDTIQNDNSWGIGSLVERRHAGKHFAASNVDKAILSQNTSIPLQSPVFEKNQQVNLADILSYALPSSLKALEFDNLVEQISIAKQENSLVNRDDSKVAKAVFLISDILEIHWDEFSLKSKVLLLNKLELFNTNAWQFILELIVKFPSALIEKSERNKKYASQYNSLNSTEQINLKQKSFANSLSLIKSIFEICDSTSKVFKKDGYLLKENKQNIDRFNHSVQTMIAGRYIMKKYSNTLEELAK
jgi:hypothetical protein